MLLYAIAAGLLTAWIIGLIAHVGGFYVHLLLLGAVVFAVIQALRPFNGGRIDNIP